VTSQDRTGPSPRVSRRSRAVRPRRPRHYPYLNLKGLVRRPARRESPDIEARIIKEGPGVFTDAGTSTRDSELRDPNPEIEISATRRGRGARLEMLSRAGALVAASRRRRNNQGRRRRSGPMIPVPLRSDSILSARAARVSVQSTRPSEWVQRPTRTELSAKLQRRLRREPPTRRSSRPRGLSVSSRSCTEHRH